MRLIRVLLAVLLSVVLGAVAAVTRLVPGRTARARSLRRLRRCWARGVLRLMRVRVRVLPAGVDLGAPALYAANHTGYLDILVVLSVTPGVLVSKAGVLWLPLIGQVAAAGGTLFVNRAHRLAVVPLIDKVRRTLRAGTSVVFFPEATSSDGKGLLPFKSSLFEAARGKDGQSFPVRPLVLCYRTVAGRPIDDSNRSCVFWYGGANLARHLWRMMAAPGVDVDVKVLPERRLSGNRGAFATELRDEMLRRLTSS